MRNIQVQSEADSFYKVALLLTLWLNYRAEQEETRTWSGNYSVEAKLTLEGVWFIFLLQKKKTEALKS